LFIFTKLVIYLKSCFLIYCFESKTGFFSCFSMAIKKLSDCR